MTKNGENILLPELYVGREQTYVKHIFLENYIERVAYNVLSFRNDFVFVDCFSGPWKSKDESLKDTSFGKATSKLQNIHLGFLDLKKPKNIRCLFIEKTKTSFKNLCSAANEIKGIRASALNGAFEDKIPEIVDFIGNTFSLVFIDPKGWTGFGLEKIKPILSLQGEIIVNFMFDHINRFINDPRPDIAATFNPLFGGNQWFVEFQEYIDKGFRVRPKSLCI